MTAAYWATAACVAAWAAFFGAECVAKELQGPSKRTPIVAAIVMVLTSAVPGIGTSLLGIWIPIMAFASAWLIRCLTYDLRVWLPWVVGVFPIVIFVYPTVAGALKGIDLEHTDNMEAGTLGFQHVWLILLLVGLNLMMWFRLFQRVLPALTFAAVASLASLACVIAGASLTISSRGEGVLFCVFFTAPGLAITGAPLLLTSLAVVMLSVIRRLDARVNARLSPPAQPIPQPQPERPPQPRAITTPPPFVPNVRDIHLDVFDCPYCHTLGVLRMSDGRCPNCKAPLEDDCRQG